MTQKTDFHKELEAKGFDLTGIRSINHFTFDGRFPDEIWVNFGNCDITFKKDSLSMDLGSFQDEVAVPLNFKLLKFIINTLS